MARYAVQHSLDFWVITAPKHRKLLATDVVLVQKSISFSTLAHKSDFYKIEVFIYAEE